MDIYNATSSELVLTHYHTIINNCISSLYHWCVEDSVYFEDILQLACVISKHSIYTYPDLVHPESILQYNSTANIDSLVTSSTLLLDLELWMDNMLALNTITSSYTNTTNTTNSNTNPMIVVYTMLIHYLQHIIETDNLGREIEEEKPGKIEVGAGWINVIEQCTTHLPYFGYNYLNYIRGVCLYIQTIYVYPEESILKCIMDILQDTLFYVSVMMIQYPLYKTNHGYIITNMDILLYVTGYPNPSTVIIEAVLSQWWNHWIELVQNTITHVNKYWKIHTNNNNNNNNNNKTAISELVSILDEIKSVCIICK